MKQHTFFHYDVNKHHISMESCSLLKNYINVTALPIQYAKNIEWNYF